MRQLQIYKETANVQFLIVIFGHILDLILLFKSLLHNLLKHKSILQNQLIQN